MPLNGIVLTPNTPFSLPKNMPSWIHGYSQATANFQLMPSKKGLALGLPPSGITLALQHLQRMKVEPDLFESVILLPAGNGGIFITTGYEDSTALNQMLETNQVPSNIGQTSDNMTRDLERIAPRLGLGAYGNTGKVAIAAAGTPTNYTFSPSVTAGDMMYISGGVDDSGTAGDAGITIMDPNGNVILVALNGINNSLQMHFRAGVTGSYTAQFFNNDSVSHTYELNIYTVKS